MASALSEDIIGRKPATTQPPSRRESPTIYVDPTALDRAIVPMAHRARRAIRRDTKAGARLMLAKPWRIQTALFGDRLGPLPDNVAELIAFAGRRRRAEESAGLNGHWTYSFNRHLALCQAVLALRVLRRAGAIRLDALW